MKPHTIIAVGFLSFSYVASQAMTAQVGSLAYGTKPGMEVTILSTSGLDTPRAVARIALTQENAEKYCEHIGRSFRPECVEKVMVQIAKRMRTEVVADCTLNSWTDMFGGVYTMYQANPSSSRTESPQFYIAEEASGQGLSGSPSSGYSVQAAIYTTLCPETAKKALKAARASDDGLNHDNEMYFGTKAGMVVSIVERQGINSNRARIKLGFTHDAAIQVCRDYYEDESIKCPAEVMNGKLISRMWVKGNCRARTWTDMHGQSYRIVGPAKMRTGPLENEYDVVRAGTKEILDGSNASGYPLAIAVFRELCPAAFERLDWDRAHELLIDPIHAQRKESVLPVPKVPLGTNYSEGDDQELASMSSDEPATNSQQTNKSSSHSPDKGILESDPLPMPDVEGTRVYTVPMPRPKPSDIMRGSELPLSNTEAKSSLGEEFDNSNSPNLRRDSKMLKTLIIDPNKVIYGDGSTQQFSGSNKQIVDRVPGGTEIPWEQASEQSPSLAERIAALESKIAGAPIQSSSEKVVCKTALSATGLQWESGPEFKNAVDEAVRRNLSIEKCRIALGYPPIGTSVK